MVCLECVNRRVWAMFGRARTADEKREENDTNTPHIHRLRFIRLIAIQLGDVSAHGRRRDTTNLWCNIRQAPAALGERARLVLVAKHSAEPEVRDLEVAELGEEQVLGLEVAVDDGVVVEVC